MVVRSACQTTRTPRSSEAGAPARQVVALEDDHVATVTAALIEQASGGGARSDGETTSRNVSPIGSRALTSPNSLMPGSRKQTSRPSVSLQAVHGGFEVGGHEGDLTEADHG